MAVVGNGQRRIDNPDRQGPRIGPARRTRSPQPAGMEAQPGSLQSLVGRSGLPSVWLTLGVDGCSGRVFACGACFILDRGEPAEASLSAPAVVGPFDPGGARDTQFLAGGQALSVENVLPYEAEERFHRGVFSARTDAARRSPELAAGDEPDVRAAAPARRTTSKGRRVRGDQPRTCRIAPLTRRYWTAHRSGLPVSANVGEKSSTAPPLGVSQPGKCVVSVTKL